MFGNLGKIMKVASDMKERMPEVQRQLEASRFEAEAGGGAVRAVVNGRLALVDVHIDEGVFADGQMDAEMLSDLLKAAVSAAQEKAALAAREAMQELTGGMDLPGLGGML
jgi:hypothetical protein